MDKKNDQRNFLGMLPHRLHPDKEKIPKSQSNSSFLIIFQTLMICGQPCRYYQDCEAARRHLSRQEYLALYRCRLALSLADDETRSST